MNKSKIATFALGSIAAAAGLAVVAACSEITKACQNASRYYKLAHSELRTNQIARARENGYTYSYDDDVYDDDDYDCNTCACRECPNATIVEPMGDWDDWDGFESETDTDSDSACSTD